MTPATIIRQAQADGVKLALSHSGAIKAVGNEAAVNRWLPVIREHKTELLAALRAGNDCEAELRRLVRNAGEYYAFTDADYALALEIALADPVAALICFRSIKERLEGRK
jgi:hypothetical protein